MRMSDRMWWSLLGFAVVLALMPGRALASEAVVTTYDGRTLTGELVSQDETTVTLLISQIKTPIPRDTIKSIEIKDSPEEQYRKLRADLDDGDLDGRYRLAYMMYEKKWFELAMKELTSLRKDFPDEGKVQTLQRVVQSRIEHEKEKEQERATASHENRPKPDQPGAVDEVTDMPGRDKMLTDAQINTIRVYEVDLAEHPRVTIPPDTIDKLFKDYASDDRLDKDQRAFKRKPGYEQLAVLFDLQARELYPDVVIRQDSPAIKEFRAKMHQRYVLNYCAAAGCHGDQSPGDLFLFRLQPNSDPTVYTNFYILNRIKRADGAMIDRDAPRRSLLLQYGLKRDAAATPHPDVKGWRPQFNSEDDPRFGQFADIIDMLWKPAPNYGIDYTPPVLRKPDEGEEATTTP